MKRDRFIGYFQSVKSFTLVEILVAIVIIAIMTGVILSLFFYCLNLNEKTRENLMAMVEVQNKLEEIRNLDYSSLSGGFFLLNNLVGSGVIYVDNFTNPDLLTITVVISWLSEKDGQAIGEDKNFNGVLDAGEDLNGNGRVDSPVSLTTFLARR